MNDVAYDDRHEGQYSELQETMYHFSDRKDEVKPSTTTQDYSDYYYDDEEYVAQRPHQSEEIIDNHQVTDSRLDVDYDYYDENENEEEEDKDYDYVYYYYYDYIDPKNLQHEKLPKPSYQKAKTVQ